MTQPVGQQAVVKRIYQCDETESLAQFIFWMGRQLANNKHKSGWGGMSPAQLIRRLKQELGELERAIEQKEPYERIASEAADVANFAMMVQDLFWREP